MRVVLRVLLCLAGPILFVASCSTGAAPGLAESCKDVPAPACFSNGDCAGAATRCSIPGNADRTMVVFCCLPGTRGTGKAGDACSGPDDCAAGLCVYTGDRPLCSQACQADTDCPAGLPRCVTLDAGVRFCGLSS